MFYRTTPALSVDSPFPLKPVVSPEDLPTDPARWSWDGPRPGNGDAHGDWLHNCPTYKKGRLIREITVLPQLMSLASGIELRHELTAVVGEPPFYTIETNHQSIGSLLWNWRMDADQYQTIKAHPKVLSYVMRQGRMLISPG